jgi:hypothetical protein
MDIGRKLCIAFYYALSSKREEIQGLLDSCVQQDDLWMGSEDDEGWIDELIKDTKLPQGDEGEGLTSE